MILGYVVFCLATALTAIVVILDPVLFDLKKIMPKHNLLENTFITYMVFLFAAMLAAPLLLPPVLIPRMTERFRDALLNSFIEVQ